MAVWLKAVFDYGMNQEEIYKGWNEELFIELQIIEKKDQIFKAKVLYNKYPWFYPKVNDRVRFLIN